MLKNPKSTKKKIANMLSEAFFIGIFAIITLITPTNTQAQNLVIEQLVPESLEKVKSVKDLERERRDAKDIKNITNRINKTRDEYVLQIRSKFLKNSENLLIISSKIEYRINKIEISGEDVSEMKKKLNSANENIEAAKLTLEGMPSKRSLLDYSEAKKYASSIIEARNNLEEAKDKLSAIISDLKDLVVSEDNEKD